jgi:hypothetical protein
MSEDQHEGYVNVMPDYSRPEVWMPLVKAMMEGHQKQTNKSVRFINKTLLTRDFFHKALFIAKDQQSFWKTIEELATIELKVLNEMEDD